MMTEDIEVLYIGHVSEAIIDFQESQSINVQQFELSINIRIQVLNKLTIKGFSYIIVKLLLQRPARFSFLDNSREFFFIFISRSRSRAVSISLSLLEKECQRFIFHFSLLKKSESYPYFTPFSREKRVKTGAGYNLTSIFVPNCISKYCQISIKHQPQNIGQISVLKS